MGGLICNINIFSCYCIFRHLKLRGSTPEAKECKHNHYAEGDCHSIECPPSNSQKLSPCKLPSEWRPSHARAHASPASNLKGARDRPPKLTDTPSPTHPPQYPRRNEYNNAYKKYLITLHDIAPDSLCLGRRVFPRPCHFLPLCKHHHLTCRWKSVELRLW